MTWSPELFIRETERELIEQAPQRMSDESFDEWRHGNLVGTPDEVSEKVATYLKLGCSGFIPWSADYPSTETIELFATKVMANFK